METEEKETKSGEHKCHCHTKDENEKVDVDKLTEKLFSDMACATTDIEKKQLIRNTLCIAIDTKNSIERQSGFVKGWSAGIKFVQLKLDETKLEFGITHGDMFRQPSACGVPPSVNYSGGFGQNPNGPGIH